MKLYLATAFLAASFAQANDSSNASGAARKDIIKSTTHLSSFDPKDRSRTSSVQAAGSSYTSGATQQENRNANMLASVHPKGRTTAELSGSIRARGIKSGTGTAVSKTIQRKMTSADPVVKLTASDRAMDDEFGKSVAVSNSTVIVGAVGDDDVGSAYIYEKNLTSVAWVEATKLTASDGATNDYFGYSLAVSDNVAIIGAYGVDDNGDASGSAYIFEKNSTSGAWIEAVKLTASDAARYDLFGKSVAVSGNTAIVGAYDDGDKGDYSGSTYIFEKNSTGAWVETVKLTASDGARGDNFGLSVAVSGNTAIIGAYGDDDNGSTSGAAYIFEKNSTGAWVEAVKLTASDGASGDSFGYSVAVSGNTAIVGAYIAASAYVFEKNSTGAWVETANLTASDGAAGDRFGWSVAASNNVVIVGAYKDDSYTGSAYIYKKDSTIGAWAEAGKLTASDGAADHELGKSVAISGNTAIVGAEGHDSYTGAAYIFDLTPTPSPTASPSSSPSTSPTAPTSSPSASPSSSPTASPSASPSSSPSTSPTAPPTSSPSASPSSSPSTSPTAPTSSPTASPSSSPSTSPTAPTSSPSASPSSSPTASPSASPSSSPSTSPTTSSPTGTKFYADWVTGDMTCKRNDGDAPQYMVNNAAAWMFDDINTCCAKFFSYKFDSCRFGASYTGSGKYYPDWAGSNEGCLEDTQSSLAPNYMKKTGAFLYTALDECCERHYSHRVNECKGLSSAGSDKYVVDWSTFKCVKDCDVADGADCGGLADGFWDLIWTFTTKEECCRTRVSWDFDGCMA